MRVLWRMAYQWSNENSKIAPFFSDDLQVDWIFTNQAALAVARKTKKETKAIRIKNFFKMSSLVILHQKPGIT